MKRRKQNAEINQTYCLIATGGHMWMRDYFDTLSPAVRQQLRKSPFNICPACLVTEVLPMVQRQHPSWPREKLLFAAIKVMEAQVRQGKSLRRSDRT